MKDFEKKARAYALKNAIAHEGKSQQGSVISALFNEGLKRSEVGKYAKKISEIVNNVNSISLEEQEKEFDFLGELVSEREGREGLPELPNAKKGKVIMRFAPAPSGPMHLGHIITGMPSSLYIKKYGGKFYVRIEDTNPEKTMFGCYKDFKRDCDWLFGNVDEYIIQSDRIPVYYKYAGVLMKKGAAYVCSCSPEKFKESVNTKTPCPCRANSSEENFKRWKMMLDKKGFKAGQAVVRFKTPKKYKGMENPNPAMRDYPLARIINVKHPRQKNKYRVWPLMHLAVPVDDIEYKMTHILRAKEHMDNAKRQKMFYEVLGLGKKFPWTTFLGRFKFLDIPLSKRKIVSAIESGEFSGWEDERLPTIFALKKRGYKPIAFERFAEKRGLSNADRVLLSKDLFNILDSFNKSSTDKR
ncbi:MAG: glutamate--tRNA ligase [Nanoarchaeota archaeon]|nr:glutamate--tRNA ligase [Nanoarchaeota archaeon]